MGKSKGTKRKLKEIKPEDISDNELPEKIRSSDEPPLKKVKWINKQRVLIFASRGISYRDRHLMQDLKNLMPHSKPESKMERKDNLFVINEICEMKNCNKCILFEGRLKRDLYMWISNVPKGPSAKFLVENVYTMAELKLTGNCLKGSRPILSFDENFTTKPHYSLLKELFVQTFGTPFHHPKSQPFTDHVITFSVIDNRIWFRNYQILSEDGALAEIGPRFVLNPIKIFNGSFEGQTIWENSDYTSPSLYRRQIRKAAANKYDYRIEKKMAFETSRPKESYHLNSMDEIFSGDPLERAGEIETQLTEKRKEMEATVSKSNLDNHKKTKPEKQKGPKKIMLKQKQKRPDREGNKFKNPKASDKESKKFKKQKAAVVKGKKFKKQKGANKNKKMIVNHKIVSAKM